MELETIKHIKPAFVDARGEISDVKTLVGLHWLQQWQAGTRSWSWGGPDQPEPL